MITIKNFLDFLLEIQGLLNKGDIYNPLFLIKDKIFDLNKEIAEFEKQESDK